MKNVVFLIAFICISSVSFAGSEFDRDITVKNQSRNDKVKTVFNEMMQSYEDEDLNEFFSFVSEDRFIQDYMVFYDAIDSDLRIFDILSIDTWVNKIEDDGVRRYLWVKWDKRFTSNTQNTEINQLGYSRFLFDEINGKYKLIELAGNNFWGASSAEWREEVPVIGGQEVYNTPSGASPAAVAVSQPDLVIENVVCTGMMAITFDLVNQGEDTIAGSIDYFYDSTMGGNDYSGSYTSDISAGQSVPISIITPMSYCSGAADESVTADPNDLIVESDETNNTSTP